MKRKVSLSVHYFLKHAKLCCEAINQETNEAGERYNELYFAKGIVGFIKKRLFFKEVDEALSLMGKKRNAFREVMAIVRRAEHYMQNEEWLLAHLQVARIYLDFHDVTVLFKDNTLRSSSCYELFKQSTKDLYLWLWQKALKFA